MSDRNVSTDFQAYTRDVVKSFVQSVVVLDDLAEMSRSDKEPEEEPVPKNITSPNDYSPISTAVDDETSGDSPKVPLKAKFVIDGFAGIGSVCAVLKADPNDGFSERTVSAARRADIVILDWTLHEWIGDETLRVLRSILQEDPDSGRLRLIAIYTGTLDLKSIYKRTRETVDEFYQDKELRENEKDLRLSKGPLHLIVLAKEGVLNGKHPEFVNLEVTESKLADYLVDVFSEMVGGLIRNAAIAGIAGIRDNAHRILAKFDPSLDPAYLGHRLLLNHPPDAEDHLDEAFGSEIASVIEEHRPGLNVNIEAIDLWLARRRSEGLQLPGNFPKGLSVVDGWHKLLYSGLKDQNSLLPNGIKKKQLKRKSTEYFDDNSEYANLSNRRFAALLTLKTRYPGRSPHLTVGTILHMYESDQDCYFFCLQPKCDSVRLCGPTGFPFVPLVPLKNIKFMGDGKPLRLVVESEKIRWQYFGIELKPSELTVLCFQPGDNPPGEVEAKEDLSGDLFFKSTDGQCYRWIAQMKDEHALRVAGEVATALARPGPNDSEWLRNAFGSPR